MTGACSEKYDIFISYRREGGETMAILLRDRLTAKGYRVFLDIESLNSGNFNEKLLSVIEDCADFLIVCSKDGLDRCVNENDWVRMEIAHALKHKKNIVPIMLRDFEWPDTLPDDIDVLRMKNGINAAVGTEFFDAAIDRLSDKFLTPLEKKKWKVRAAAILMSIFVIIGIVFLSNTDFGAPEEGVNAGASINQENQADIFSENGDANISTPETVENAEQNTTPVTITAPLVTQVSKPAVDFITIKGVEYNTALYELDLSDKNLTNADISPLRHMKNIEVLNLGGNQISDLTPLLDLTSLKKLSLYDNNRIRDLTPLKNLTNLMMLSLYFNPISDITALSGLTKLEELYFGENQIGDLTPLSGLTNLKILRLNNNQIRDLTPLSGLTKLEELYFGENQIGDLTPLSGLTNLRILRSSNNQIRDLTPLSGLANLTDLSLNRNQIDDLTPLSGLTNLRNLFLSDNQINNWSSVEHVRAVFGRP